MNNPFEYTPSAECRQAFEKLEVKIEKLRESAGLTDINFIREIDAGKMLGVMIAEDEEHRRHILYAYSGQLGDAGFQYPGFVGAAFDYLQPEGYFLTREREISRQNREIKEFEEGELVAIKNEYESEKDILELEISAYKEECLQSRLRREQRRKAGGISEAERKEMIRQSQFEKAELRRRKHKMAEKLAPIEERLDTAMRYLKTLKGRRRKGSEELQDWLFDHFQLLNARGEKRSLRDIFASTPLKYPPSGAGECCAPKLLQAVYQRGWRPVEIAEYWYGEPKGGEVRIHGHHYPACRGKCLPILRWMLEGEEVAAEIDSGKLLKNPGEPKIVFENEWFCVADKPSGMLSVPGKIDSKSLEEWLNEHFVEKKWVKPVHRLDQDTSGLLIAAFDEDTFKLLQAMFARREMKKTYEALLEGDYEASGIASKGGITLPLCPDWLDRPRQRVDFKEGKVAVTEYEFMEVKDGRSRVTFHPLTGRTHQLRVHAASVQGLGMPIAGDRLYGKKIEASDRLCLHAKSIEFTFPKDERHYRFTSEVPF